MTDDTRVRLVVALIAAAVVWRVAVAVHRDRAGDARPGLVFWLHMTAPWVALVLMAAALVLLLGTDRIRKHRGFAAALPPYTSLPY